MSEDSITELRPELLDDDQLFAHLLKLRRRGAVKEYRLALSHLVYRHESLIRQRLEAKLFRHEVGIHLDDLVGEVILGAIKASFDGSHYGEFRSLLNTIVARRVADFVDKATRSPRSVPWAEETEDDDVSGAVIVGPDTTVSEVSANMLKQASLPENPVHARVVVLHIFEGHGAAAVAATICEEAADGSAMTENNVHQIAKRFRDNFSGLIAEGIL